MTPDTNTIYVWHSAFETMLPFLPLFDSWLSSDEIKKANTFYFERDQKAYRISHACLRFIISQYLNASPTEHLFKKHRLGKPALTTEALSFNLSHSKTHFAVAIHAQHPVGVDIESMAREKDTHAIAQRFFHPEEYKWLDAKDPATFYRLWTCKEAILKAIGCGLSMQLKQCVIRFVDDNNACVCFKDTEHQNPAIIWNIRSFQIDHNQYLSVAYPKQVKQLTRFDGDALGRLLSAQR
jgi:4'-phosphopantetheinyl transferase